MQDYTTQTTNLVLTVTHLTEHANPHKVTFSFFNILPTYQLSPYPNVRMQVMRQFADRRCSDEMSSEVSARFYYSMREAEKKMLLALLSSTLASPK